jgi:hypothetical protein
MGLAPTLFLKPMEPAVTRVVQRVKQAQNVNVGAGALPARPPLPHPGQGGTAAAGLELR